MEDKLDEYLFNFLSDTEKQQLLKDLGKDKTLQKKFTNKLNTLSLVMMQEKEGDGAYTKNKLSEFKLKTRKIFLRKITIQIAKYAAVILLTIGIYSIYQNQVNNYTNNDYVSFDVPNGQRARLLLPDGTDVWLNAGSKLKYPSAFSKKNRNVYLEGEAYFEVTSDKRNPFKVSTSLMTVNVLGTKFDVKSYPDENTSVALMEGIVELDIVNNPNKLTLKPNEQVSISPETERIILSKQNQTDAISLWISGEFSYVNKPLYAIVNDLERQYDANITILDNDLAEDLFTSRSTEKENIVQILNRLKGTRKLDYIIDGDSIKIFKQ